MTELFDKNGKILSENFFSLNTGDLRLIDLI